MFNEKFMEFVNSNKTTTEDGYYCKVIQNGITYIMFGDISEGNLLSEYTNKMKVAGFTYNGRFYGVDYNYRDYDVSFYKALADFEKTFNDAYKTAVNSFTLDNPAPITEVTKASIAKNYRNYNAENFEYYKQHTVIEEAKRDIFGVVESPYKEYDTHKEKFTSIFFDCLKYPEKFDDYVQTAIEEKSDVINYRLKCEAEKKKKIEELKQNPVFMQGVKMYKALENIKAKTVKMTCNLYGEVFELPIERDRLMRELAYNADVDLWNFTKAAQTAIMNIAEKQGVKKYEVKINFTDIVKITYGRNIIYSKE